jgi:toxin CptA
MRNYAIPTTAHLILIWLLALPALWFSLVRTPAVRVDIGAWGDHALLRGAHGPEESSTENYRWTTAASALHMPNLSASYRLLSMRAHGWRPSGASPIVHLVVNDQPWGSIQTSVPLRLYQVLLPEQSSTPKLDIAFASQAYQPPGDPRTIGFAIDWATLKKLGSNPMPAPWQFTGQAILLALVLALTSLLRVYPTITGTLATLALLALNLAEPLWLSLALVPWIILACGTILATLAVRLWFERWLQPWMTSRQAQLALMLLVAGLVLRMAGATHPFFDSHDLSVHTRWMETVFAGELYLYSTPSELQDRLTFNPPAGYVLLLPLWLLIPDLRLVVQVGTALIDWAGLTLLLPLIRELRLRPRTALIALGLYAALPINLTMLWWGFAANDIAQTLWILLLWLILRLVGESKPKAQFSYHRAHKDTEIVYSIGSSSVPRCSLWFHLQRWIATSWHLRSIAAQGTTTTEPVSSQVIILISIVAAICALTHVGALVLVIVMLGMLSLASLIVVRRRGWLLLVPLAIAGIFTVLIYFSAVVPTVLLQPASPQARTLAESLERGIEMRELRMYLVGQAFVRGFSAVLLAILPVGLVLLWQSPRRHPLLQPLVGISLLVSMIFFLVYMGLGFLTRYIYFATPLICIACAVALQRLLRSPAGKIATITLVVIVAIIGVNLWFSGVLLRDKPSVVPLTH